jgi:hypothetical protein
LNKALECSKATEEVALEWAQKANEITEGLHKEVEVERQSSHALGAQVELLTKRLEEAASVGLSAAKVYINALGEFGGVTTSLPSEPSAYGLFSWMKSNFTKLLGLYLRLLIFVRSWPNLAIRMSKA